MSELFFVVKTVLFSVLVLIGLQMKVGGVSIEERSRHWIYQSQIGSELQSVARGATKAGHEGWTWVQQKVSSHPEKSSKAMPPTKRTHKENWEDDLD